MDGTGLIYNILWKKVDFSCIAASDCMCVLGKQLCPIALFHSGYHCFINCSILSVLCYTLISGLYSSCDGWKQLPRLIYKNRPVYNYINYIICIIQEFGRGFHLENTIFLGWLNWCLATLALDHFGVWNQILGNCMLCIPFKVKVQKLRAIPPCWVGVIFRGWEMLEW